MAAGSYANMKLFWGSGTWAYDEDTIEGKHQVLEGNGQNVHPANGPKARENVHEARERMCGLAG